MKTKKPCPFLAHTFLSFSFFPFFSLLSSSPGLLPGRRLLALRDLLKTPNGSPLLPHPWSLLLALGLLCELADPAAPRRLYASLLPTPPGTPVSAAAPFGPAATDVLLFGSRELDALRCEPLAKAARRERKRLAALHGLLFGGGGEGGLEGDESRGDDDGDGGEQQQRPSVSLVSFLWAHALVRSRALDLRVVGGCGGGGGGGGEVCLLPLIDLAQHDDGKGGGGGAPATLRLVSSPPCSSSSPSPSPPPSPAAVELVAGASAIPRGSPVCLDYGSRPLRDLLRGYAFVPKLVAAPPRPPPPPAPSEPPPAPSPPPPPPAPLFRVSEVFEDFSGGALANRAALVVDASASRSSGGASPSLLRLAAVRLLARPGGEDPALEFGRARVVFVVVAGGGGGGGGGGEGCCGGGDGGGGSCGIGSSSPVIFTATDEEIPMQPEAEVGVCRWVARECEELASEIEGWGAEDGTKEEERASVDAERAERPPSSWLSRAAEELASDYRAARVSLLRRCAESLEAQAWLVESSLGDAVNY